MRCIIIDDETKAIEVIERYVLDIPYLELIACFRNSIKAVAFLQETSIDLVFVDINMPKLNGLDLIRALPYKPEIIITTAHPQHAVEGFDLSATDYLLKPISFERFFKAVNKANESYLLKRIKSNSDIYSAASQTSGIISIKSGTETHLINLQDILFIEKDKNYLYLNTVNGKISAKMSLPDIINLLPSDKFIRVHKSFIIAIPHIQTIGHHLVVLQKFHIPIGPVFKT